MALTPRRILSDAPFAHRLEKRAEKIADPVEKLRYLRRSAGVSVSAARTRRFAACALVALGLAFATYLRPGSAAPRATAPAIAAPAHASGPAEAGAARVWLVEEKGGTEFYSNGLRIERKFETAAQPRVYRALHRDGRGWVECNVPAGIVFHTTESNITPFSPEHNDKLREVGSTLLAYVRERELYNFVVDRFGRVFRVVREMDAANHAGRSVWADTELVYFDLNTSFLGVSFEAQTDATAPSWTPAQAASARLLTEMLRNTYGIAAGNCVTHAQVSVNPNNMMLGYHTDWGSSFPFHELGLRNGYEEANPAVLMFGFEYGPDLLAAVGGKPWPGLVASEQQLVMEAAAAGKTTAAYRGALQKKYRQMVDAAHLHTAATERSHNES